MNLFSWIKIQAEAIMKEKRTPLQRKLNPLLQTHFNNVSKVVKQIKDDGDIIQMSQQAMPIGNEDETNKGYQSVIFHGMTRSAEKKTFIRTLPDGTMQKWTESVA